MHTRMHAYMHTRHVRTRVHTHTTRAHINTLTYARTHARTNKHTHAHNKVTLTPDTVTPTVTQDKTLTHDSENNEKETARVIQCMQPGNTYPAG